VKQRLPSMTDSSLKNNRGLMQEKEKVILQELAFQEMKRLRLQT